MYKNVQTNEIKKGIMRKIVLFAGLRQLLFMKYTTSVRKLHNM